MFGVSAVGAAGIGPNGEVKLGTIRTRIPAIGVALLLGLAACQGSAGSQAPTNGGGQASTPGGASTLAPAARLDSALSTMANGYSFESTVTAGGKFATRATGTWIGGTSEFVVTAKGASVTYRTVPPRSWVLEKGKTWVELDATMPGGDPLDALKQPTSAVDGPTVAGQDSIRASYPAAALGLASPATVVVDIAIGGDGTVTARYASGSGSASATSETVLKPDAGIPRIVAPPAPS